MADVVETTKVEEETTPIKEVTKEVPVEAVATTDEKAKDAPADEPVKEGENGSAAEEVNGKGAKNGSTNGVGSTEATEETDGDKAEEPEQRKRKSEGVEVPDATDGVSAEKKAKLEEKSDKDEIEAPANGEAEVTA